MHSSPPWGQALYWTLIHHTSLYPPSSRKKGACLLAQRNNNPASVTGHELFLSIWCRDTQGPEGKPDQDRHKDPGPLAWRGVVLF